MKRVVLSIFILLFTLISHSVYAQYKVVDKSSRKAPKWLDKAESEVIITSAIALDIESAKAQCLENIKIRIIESVAQNVGFGTESTIKQIVNSDGISDFSDEFTSNLKTKSASIPFIKGVSISKVLDSYWEKRIDRKTKEISYLYAVKYPFPSLELKKLTREFEKRDKEMNSKYLELESGVEGVGSTEDIARAILALNPLIEYFFDDVRKNSAISLQKSYNKLYDNITIETTYEETGEAVIAFKLEGRDIKSSQRPKIKTSEEVIEVKYSNVGNSYTIGYNYELCDLNTPYDISLIFSIGNKSVSHKIYFTVIDTTPIIEACNQIYLSAVKDEHGDIKELVVNMDILSKNCDSFTIQSITLSKIPDVVGAITIDNINKKISGNGVHAVEVKHVEKLYIVKISGDKTKVEDFLYMVRGNIKGYYGDFNTQLNSSFVLSCKGRW